MTTLDQSARRAGAHHWVESRLFAVLGGWVATTDDLDAKLMLDRHSQHHAWRAGQWWDRLPVLADVDRATLSVAPDGRMADALDRLTQVENEAGRLAGTYRVALPRLWVAYDRHRQEADAVADGSTLRTLGVVAPDLAADWREGEAVLQGLLSSESAISEAALTVSALEALLAG